MLSPTSKFSVWVDIFIILESSGLDLRKRLLALSKPYLPQVDFDFLSHRLIAGINRTTRLPSEYYSMLSASCTGHLDFISKAKSESATFGSAYEEALSLLEYGDLEQAQDLLARDPAIGDCVGNMAVHKLGENIVNRLLLYTTEVNGDDVSLFADFQAANLLL